MYEGSPYGNSAWPQMSRIGKIVIYSNINKSDNSNISKTVFKINKMII